MKTSFINSCTLLILTALIAVSCAQTSKHGVPVVNPDLIVKDFGTWWNYNCKNVHLSENYIPLDSNSKVISRESFLTSLSSGKYIALKMLTSDSLLKYKLYSLKPTIDSSIGEIGAQFAKSGLEAYRMEGTEIPDFNYTDLNGNVYNKENTKGKIVVLKCWFVHCLVCVQEMPALNELVKEFKGRSDIVFLSLAYDSKERLKKFLIKTKFDYPVASVEQKYIQEKLKVSSYPTHFIINRQGLISKVVTDYHEMISCLNREIKNNPSPDVAAVF